LILQRRPSLITEVQLLKMKFHITAHELLSLCFISLLAFAQPAHADSTSASHIVKWKDDRGATHYGDRIPAQYANRENSIINQHGITVKRNKPANYQDPAIDLAKQEQDKKDKALLSAFTNENEIDLARDRNLQLDKVTVEGLQLQKINSQKRLADIQKYADGFSKRKKPIPADLTADMQANQTEITKQDQQITERKAAMEITRKRFDDDKLRYIALKNHTTENSALPESAPTANLPVKSTDKPAVSGNR